MPADPRPLSAQGRPLSGLAALLGVVMAGPGPDPFTGPHGPLLVRGVAHDSRRVRPGDLYAALAGGNHHGAEFCQAAVSAGAVAVLTDPAGRSGHGSSSSPTGPPLLAWPSPWPTRETS